MESFLLYPGLLFTFILLENVSAPLIILYHLCLIFEPQKWPRNKVYAIHVFFSDLPSAWPIWEGTFFKCFDSQLSVKSFLITECIFFMWEQFSLRINVAFVGGMKLVRTFQSTMTLFRVLLNITRSSEHLPGSALIVRTIYTMQAIVLKAHMK